MPRATPLLLLLLLATTSGRAFAQSLQERLNAALTRVDSVLAESFGRSLPLPSGSAGVSYAFDPATGNFQREPATFGQVYLDRADTIGAKRLNVQFAYQYVKLDELGGQDAEALRDPTPIYVPGRKLAIAIPELNVHAAVHEFLFALTYGLTDDLETTVAVPVEYSDLALGGEFAAVGVSADDGSLTAGRADVDERMQPVGVGDVLLRAKYRLLGGGPIRIAADLLLRLPTGEEEDFQGVGFFEVAPAILASTRTFEPASWAHLQGHLNVGIGFDTEDVGASEARWGLGVDWGITEGITAAVAVLGRNQFARVAPPGFFDFPRCPNASLVACATSEEPRGGDAPLFGLSGDRADYYDVSIGGRGAVWRDTVFALVNVLVPLNDGFVRTAPIPLVGVEATF